MEKFNIVANGYDIDQVNTFVNSIIQRVEKMIKENEQYQKEIEKLKVSNREHDMNFNQALIAIQETTDRMKELARTESTMIIEDAKKNANAIVHEALINAERTEIEAENLRKNIVICKNKLKNILESQLEITKDFDDVNFN